MTILIALALLWLASTATTAWAAAAWAVLLAGLWLASFTGWPEAEAEPEREYGTIVLED